MLSFYQKGFTPMVILIIITVLVGGIVVAKKFIQIPSGQTVTEQPIKEETAASGSANISNQPKATTTPKPIQNLSTTGNLEVFLSGPEDAVPPLVRLFDSALKMVYEDNGYQQPQYARPSNGYKYTLKNLNPGTYLVGAAGNFYFKPQNVTIQAGKTANLTLQLNPSSTKITTTLTGRTFVDSNGNKKYDLGELNVSGVIDENIYLLTKDGEKRVYGFSGLPGGPYDLGGTGQHFLGKYIFKSGTQPGYVPVNFEVELGLYNTSNNVDIPFTTQTTYTNPSSIKGHVFVDTNGNGQYDNGELKPNNYFPSISLEKPGGQFRYSTVTTDNNGGYSFSNLSPGDYVVVVNDVPNYSAKQSEISVSLGSGQDITINFLMLPK